MWGRLRWGAKARCEVSGPAAHVEKSQHMDYFGNLSKVTSSLSNPTHPNLCAHSLSQWAVLPGATCSRMYYIAFLPVWMYRKKPNHFYLFIHFNNNRGYSYNEYTQIAARAVCQGGALCRCWEAWPYVSEIPVLGGWQGWRADGALFFLCVSLCGGYWHVWPGCLEPRAQRHPYKDLRHLKIKTPCQKSPYRGVQSLWPFKALFSLIFIFFLINWSVTNYDFSLSHTAVTSRIPAVVITVLYRRGVSSSSIQLIYGTAWDRIVTVRSTAVAVYGTVDIPINDNDRAALGTPSGWW